MERSSLDLMSSPDPLNESIPSSAAPFTKRITRSQRSQRFASLSNPSPRKQTFELDVGDPISPQKILVTVEAEEPGTDNVSRRLFTSPAPPKSAGRSTGRRRTKTTTTTVPLKGMTDDEDDGYVGRAATPKRRGPGRPRRSGTPTPSVRKRAGTPVKRTPRKAKATDETTESDIGMSSSRAAPRSASKPRKTPARKSATPAKKKDSSTAQDSQPKKRGRPRRQALAPEELASIADQDTREMTIVIPEVPTSESISEHVEEDLRTTPTPGYEGDYEEEDIWMANLGDEPTPVVHRSSPRRSTPRQTRSVHLHVPEAEVPENTLTRRSSPRRSASRQSSSVCQAESDVGLPGDMLSDVDALESKAPMEQDDRSDAESYVSEDAGPRRPDLDTIAQGEDFSMIGVESLPSFQHNSSVAQIALPEMGEETSLIVSQTLESLRQGQSHEDDGDAEVEDETTPTAPRRVSQPSEASIANGAVSDGPLFSQPASPQGWARSPRRNKATPLGRQLALKSLGDAGTPTGAAGAKSASIRATRNNSPAVVVVAEEQSMLYEDSFSEIPEAVLEAATPRRVWRQHLGLGREAGEDSMMMDPDEPAANDDTPTAPPPKPMSITSSGTKSGSNRLLTPEDSIHSEETQKAHDHDEQPQSELPAMSELPSSPPLIAQFRMASDTSSTRHSRHRSDETPMMLAALSPRLPLAPAAGASNFVDNLAVASGSSRPTLSPILRAGRALQSVTSDPPSPRDQSQLGSPFRGTQSPTGSLRHGESGVQPPRSPTPTRASSVPQEDRTWSTRAFAPFSQLKNLVVQGAQVFSPRSNAAPAGAAEDQTAPGQNMVQLQRPFQGAARLQSSPPRSFDLGATMSSSTRAGPPSDDGMGMDWEADPIQPNLAEQQGTTRSSSSVVATLGSEAGRRQDLDSGHETEEDLDGEESDEDPEVYEEKVETEEEVDEEEDEEEDDAGGYDQDIWAVEAQRPASAKRKATDPMPEPPRRSKLPSPWRKNSQRLRYSDEVTADLFAQMGSQPAVQQDFSMLSTQSGTAVTHVAEQHAMPKGRVDLSAFFSSPAMVPQMLRPGEEPVEQQVSSQQPKLGQTFGVPATKTAENKPSLRPTSLRRVTQASSISHRLFDTNAVLPSIPQKELQLGGQRKAVDLFSPDKPQAIPHSESTISQDRPTSPPTPDRRVFATIPQKRNFTPRAGKPTVSLFNPPTTTTLQVPPISVFTSQILSDPFTATAAADTSHDSSFEAPALKPLPPKQASPSKSCLRSPLKPKTPGRVVEFTSSTLSPLAVLPNAPALADWAQRFQPLDGDKLPGNGGKLPGDGDAAGPGKENTAPGGVHSLFGAPLARPGTPKAKVPLGEPGRAAPAFQAARNNAADKATEKEALAVGAAAGKWTRAHWLKLDALLQEHRRGGPLNFQLRHGPGSRTAHRGGGGGTAAVLLGKQVVAQGETLTLEQWHLDVVDAFRDEVGGAGAGGGWSEAVLAKRLFALLVGEERRRLGLVPVRRGAGGEGMVV